MRDTSLSLKLELFEEKWFDDFKKEKPEDEAKPDDNSDEELEPYLTFVNNLLRILIFNGTIDFNISMAYNANGLYPLKAQASNDSISSSVRNEGILACHGYSFEEFPEEAFDLYPFTDRASFLGTGAIFSLNGRFAFDFFYL